MADDSDSGPTLDEDDVGSRLYDIDGGEIGTIRDYDEDRVYVEPSEDFDDDERLDTLGWRTPDGSFQIDTDAIQGLPDDAVGDHGVDLSAYEDPDEDADSTSE